MGGLFGGARALELSIGLETGRDRAWAHARAGPLRGLDGGDQTQSRTSGAGATQTR